MRCIRLLAGIGLALGFAAGTAQATGVSSGYPFQLSVTAGGNAYTLGDLPITYTPYASGTGGNYTLNSPVTVYDASDQAIATITNWGSDFQYDPQVTNNFTIVNNSLVAQVFSVSVTSPIAAVLPTSLMRGSIGITLTDEGPLNGLGETDGSASLTSVSATDTYRAFLDGVAVQSLFPDVYSQSCALANCTNTQNASFGIPVRIAGPGATSTMGITVQFLLSPGDSAGVTSVFNIIPIPEPSTAATFGLGLLGLAIAGRRRSA